MAKTKFLRRLNLFFKGTALFFNVCAVLWLLICLLSSFYDVKGKSSYISFFSFSTFFALAANVFFIFFWLFTRKRFFSLVSIIAIIICLPVVRPVFGLHPFSADASVVDNDLKIMTWNVHLFDLGEWTENKQTKNKIIDFIKQQDPDILCLQEYYYDIENPGEPYLELLLQLGYNYHEFALEGDYFKRNLNISFKKDDIINIGTIVFSKFPLSNMKRYSLDYTGYYNMIGVDVLLDDRVSFRLFSTHLQSVTLNSTEVAYAEKKVDNLTTKATPKAKGILAKLMLASAKRGEQANAIDSVIKASGKPSIICGDFNDMPGSYVYRKVKGNLSDIFVDAGFGFGRTYRKIVPTLRIDYILYDSYFLEGKAYSSPDLSLSDHNPVIATFSIKKPAK